MGQRRPVLPLAPPEQSGQELCPHGLREHPPLWGTSTDPSCSLLPPLEVRWDQITYGGWDGVHERQTSSRGALSFLLTIFLKGYFYCYQEKFTQYSCSSVGANQWYRWGAKRLPVPVCLVWANELYPSLFVACHWEQMEDINALFLPRLEGGGKREVVFNRQKSRILE